MRCALLLRKALYLPKRQNNSLPCKTFRVPLSPNDFLCGRSLREFVKFSYYITITYVTVFKGGHIAIINGNELPLISMQFFSRIRRSIYNPLFYQDLANKPFSFSLAYFFLLIAFLVLLITIWFSFSSVPQVNAFLKNLGPQVLSMYPDDLVITIEDGEASTNVPEPYAMKMQDFFGPQAREELAKRVKKNLLIIDTKHAFTIENFRAYNTYVLLTKENVIIADDKGQIRIQSLADMPNTVINKSLLEHLINRITPSIAFAPFLVIMGTFIGLFFFYSVNLLYLFFGALIVWAIAKIRKLSIGYKKSYQIALHAITPSLLIYSLIFMTTPSMGIPFLFTLILALCAWLNLTSKKAQALENVQQSQPQLPSQT